ncbi:hypothetical protein D3C72_2049740 [compost metagenome]
MTSPWVVSMPCGKPAYTFSVPCFSSLTDSREESSMGTIWSSSPCMTRVGTVMAFRSSVWSVSENALMPS